MKNIITVAELVATGEIKDGRYTDPYVAINTPEEQDILTIDIEELRGDVILCFPFRYREATTLNDVPIFKLRLCDDEGMEFDSIESGNVPEHYLTRSDRPGRWTYFDADFRFNIDPEIIPVGPNASYKTFQCHLEVVLRRFEWPDEEGGEFEEVLPLLKKEMTIPVRIRALAKSPVWFEVAWSTSGFREPSYGNFYHFNPGYPRWTYRDKWRFKDEVSMIQYFDESLHGTQFGRRTDYQLGLTRIAWKSDYHLNFKIINKSDKTITGWKIHLAEQAKSDSGEPVGEPAVLELIENQETGAQAIPAGETAVYSTPSLIKNWEWYSTRTHEFSDMFNPDSTGPNEFFSINNPVRRYHYSTSLIKIDFDAGGCEINEPDKVANGLVDVTVSSNKISAIRSYGRTEFDEVTIKTILLVGGVVFFVLGIPASGTAAVVITIIDGASIVAGIAVEAGGNLNNHYLDEANDPIYFDENYTLPHNYRELIKETSFKKGIPDELAWFTIAFNEIIALSGSINISHARYMSALAKQDDTSALLQRETAENMLSLIGDKIVTMKKNLASLKEIFAEQLEKADRQVVEDALQNVRDQGLPEAFVEEKLSEGYTQEQLNQLEAQFAHVNVDDVLVDQSPEFERLYQDAMDIQVDALSTIKEIQRITALSEKALLGELLREDLISQEECTQRLAQASTEECALLMELEYIDDITRVALAKQGIFGTDQLLDRCATTASRKRLAEECATSKDKLLEWANRADLMRVAGISPRDADTLENVGVDTVVELSNRNPENLHEKIIDYLETTQWAGSISKQQISQWIETAKGLSRRLEY